MIQKLIPWNGIEWGMRKSCRNGIQIESKYIWGNSTRIYAMKRTINFYNFFMDTTNCLLIIYSKNNNFYYKTFRENCNIEILYFGYNYYLNIECKKFSWNWMEFKWNREIFFIVELNDRKLLWNRNETQIISTLDHNY